MQIPIVQVKDFSKSYNNFTAVDRINFSIYSGEIFALLGPNGAGKTSTLECLEGLRQPSSGKISIDGINPALNPQKLTNIIGVQLQSSGLPESITPNEAMKIFCAYHDVNPRFDLLNRLGLNEKLNTQFHQLSTGQQRRLSLALAVAHNPKVLFLDEPTAGLDVATRVELHSLLRELKKIGTAIILATHDMAEAEELSDRIAILLKGKLITIGSPLEITATGDQLTKISVKTKNKSISINSFDPISTKKSYEKDQYQIFFSENIGKSLSSIIEYIDANNDILLDLRVERPTLEDRFLEITTNGDNNESL